MRNYLVFIAIFFITITQAQIMLPAYQAIQYRRKSLPIITSALTCLTSTTAASGGTITSDGGTPVTVRGVCWSTTPGPTIALPTKTNDGSGIGAFISNLLLLIPNTTYYVRAYATNNIGTAYGDELTFTTTTAPPPLVTIGTQVWTTKNLDVTTYRDGTPIPQVTDPNAWSNLTTGAWCYYNNDPLNGQIYGKLYNWYAVAGIYNTASLNNLSLRKQIAPIGFHVPSEVDYQNLESFLGGAVAASSKMREVCTTLWIINNQDATNTSGFTALPSGRRVGSSGWDFNSIGYDCQLWTSNQFSAVVYHVVTSYNNYIQGIQNYNGSSIRLIMD
jgi:uncharacterized protein (TIGR02145 family)